MTVRVVVQVRLAHSARVIEVGASEAVIWSREIVMARIEGSVDSEHPFSLPI
jgi:hypothetical protein